MRQSAEILSTHTPALFRAAAERAAELLRAGEVVALPTETVYGLAANALDPAAVAKIYAIKGRPAHNPIIVHVASLPMAHHCVTAWPDAAQQLALAFWPGPLTMVLPRAKTIPDIVTAGGETVGVRWPSHPFMQEVIKRCDFPLAAPSANPSNQLSPTNATHVAKFLGRKLKLIVDGGQSQVGIESTVIDLTAQPPRVLRPGIIHDESLAAVISDFGFRISDLRNADQVAGVLRSPGMLRKHYSPKAKLMVLSWRDDADLLAQLRTTHHATRSIHVLAHTRVPSMEGFADVSLIPHDAEAFARALYVELHRLDELGAEVIVVEALPDAPEWRGIADRLARAAAE
jgi:L-threonylcarbamoyladenylate synthase